MDNERADFSWSSDIDIGRAITVVVLLLSFPSVTGGAIVLCLGMGGCSDCSDELYDMSYCAAENRNDQAAGRRVFQDMHDMHAKTQAQAATAPMHSTVHPTGTRSVSAEKQNEEDNKKCMAAPPTLLTDAPSRQDPTLRPSGCCPQGLDPKA